MDVAVIGAAGVCGRQTVMQLLSRNILPDQARLQLVGRRGGASASELWGLRADLSDAFADWSPTLDVVLDAEEVDAELVIMMAGATVSGDPGATVDRAQLGAANARIFDSYARVLATSDRNPIVIVQSNPVELGVEIFAEALGAHRVLGAAGHSDALRFSLELAVELGVPRRRVQAFTIGQHGDYLVPVWSRVSVRGVPEERVQEMIARARAGRSLAELPDEIRYSKTRMLELIRSGDVGGAYTYVKSLPPDLRACVKPFFTHFTAGRTTEVVTAKSAADISENIIDCQAMAFSTQVHLVNDQIPGVRGPAAVPILLGPDGWRGTVAVELAPDEDEAFRVASQAINESTFAARAAAGV